MVQIPPPLSQKRGRMNPKKIKLGIFLTFFIISLSLFFITVVLDYNHITVQNIIIKHEYFSVFLYIILVAIAAVTTIPITVTLVAGVFIFSFWLTVFYAFLGILIGASILFLFSRKMGRKVFVEYAEFKKGRLRALNDLLQENSLNIILLFNFIYFFPSNLAHMIGGITKINFSKFLFLTIIGNFPNMFSITLLVYGIINSNTIFIVIAVIILILTTGIPLYIYRKHMKDILVIAFNRKRL